MNCELCNQQVSEGKLACDHCMILIKRLILAEGRINFEELREYARTHSREANLFQSERDAA
jgi:hypothetical protein